MSDQFYVEIVKYEGDEVIERRGPFREWKADKVDDGLNINLNHDAYYTRIVEEVATARCRICENRAMSDQEMPPEAWEIASPSGVRHLTEGSGYTFCGKNCAPWERREVATTRER